MPVVLLDDVWRSFRLGETDVHALAGVDLAIDEGEYVAIMGPSGSGKSTLLNVLGCLDRPSQGRYLLGGRDVSDLEDDELSLMRSKSLGFVFQNYNLIPQLDVLENVEVPLFYAGVAPAQARERALELATRLGLAQRLDHRPMQLSGGQQQRVAIARALANDPLVLLGDEPTGNLDSKTGEEILGLLDTLHRGGKTLVIVTHDPDVASRADRVVRMIDGRVDRIEVQRTRGSVLVIGYRLGRVLRLAGKSLWLHRLRSILTALGMVFGVMSVVAMLAIGEGASRDAQQQYLRLGSRNLILRSVKPAESAGASTQRTWVVAYGLDLGDLAAIRETVPHIAKAVARRDIPKDLWNGGRKFTGSVFGAEPSYRDVTNLQVEQGRWLTDEDGRTRKNVAVLGAAVAEALFPISDPLEGSVRVGSDYYGVVGVVSRRGTAPASGAGASGEEDSAIFVPLEAALERFSPLIQVQSSGSRVNERVALHQIVVEVKDIEEVPAAAAALRSLLAKRHPKQDVRLTVPLELLEEAARTKRLFTYILGVIAGGSLLVGGIGIMNITLASVTERTREIGIRRALGAKKRDIVGQFLAETLLLSAIGGAIGLPVGVGLPYMLEKIFDVATFVTPMSLILALAVSAGTGVVFGLYPASRAAALDPVEALRHD